MTRALIRMTLARGALALAGLLPALNAQDLPLPNPQNETGQPGVKHVQPPGDQPPAHPQGSAGVVVLTRGPVHEAFAGPISDDPVVGVHVPRMPRDPIEEVPPEMRPGGENVMWIPGYWAWDDERGDFLWVTGIWRDLPPGRQWISGYWQPAVPGAQWISGYWIDRDQGEVQYLPEPPASNEEGPTSGGDESANDWVPGCWVWREGGYAWRPGYWQPSQPDWMWQPDHYVVTPCGYVFVDGYWDHDVAARGTLFAPVSFDDSFFAQPAFEFTPTIMIEPAAFEEHLFVRPAYHHYYFGDYYAPEYREAGYVADFEYRPGVNGYDPIWGRGRWAHRDDADAWTKGRATAFERRREHAEERPPRIYEATLKIASGGAGADVPVRAMASPYVRVADGDDRRYRKLTAEDRKLMVQTFADVRRARSERQRLESNSAGTAPLNPPQGIPSPASIKIPKSPIMARPIGELSREYAPPRRHPAPDVDPRVKPHPRDARLPRAEPDERPKDKSDGGDR